MISESCSGSGLVICSSSAVDVAHNGRSDPGRFYVPPPECGGAYGLEQTLEIVCITQRKIIGRFDFEEAPEVFYRVC